MAAHRNVHLSKKVYHLVDGDSEFACHVGNEKLAQKHYLLESRRRESRAVRPAISLSFESTTGGIAETIPFASPASVIPITATDSLPATPPSSAPVIAPITGTRRALRSDETLSKLFCDASLATSATFNRSRLAASRTS
jgi:hypothetical protein